jgi:hypothetical protein
MDFFLVIDQAFADVILSAPFADRKPVYDGARGLATIALAGVLSVPGNDHYFAAAHLPPPRSPSGEAARSFLSAASSASITSSMLVSSTA